MVIGEFILLRVCILLTDVMIFIGYVQMFMRMQEVEALSRAGETVFTALRPYDLHDSIVSVVFIYYKENSSVIST